MTDQFHALGFPTAERRTGLAEFQVAEAGFAKRLQRTFDSRETGEEVHGFIHRQFQNLRDVFAAEFDVESFAVETAAVENLAANESRRQEVHFELDVAGALAFGATPLRAIE